MANTAIIPVKAIRSGDQATGDVIALGEMTAGDVIDSAYIPVLGSGALAATGTATGTFGSASKVPVITVAADGRITSISNVAVAGVSSVGFTSGNNNLRISTSDGTTHDVTIAVGDKMTVANTQALYNTVVANSATWAALTATNTAIRAITTTNANKISQVESNLLATNTAIRSLISTEVSGLVNSAPATLDTLSELANALGNNASFATSVATNLGQKLGATATVTLTGDVTASATAFSANAVSLSTTLADSGTPTGTFGSNSKVPVITVNSKGQITNISNAEISGVTGFDYYSSNSTFVISTSSTNYQATIPQGFTNSTVVEFPTGDYFIGGTTETYIGEVESTDAFGVKVSPGYDCMEPLGSYQSADLGAFA